MNSFDQVEPEGQEEYHPIETSPFIDEDGKKICGNENWNRCIDSLDYHYPLINEKISENVCELTYVPNEDDEPYTIKFTYVVTKNNQKYFKISTELKYYYSNNDDHEQDSKEELEELNDYFIFIIDNGILNIIIKHSDKTFLTESLYTNYISSNKICSSEEYYINTVQFYYPINRDKGHNVLKECMLNLKNHILNLM